MRAAAADSPAKLAAVRFRDDPASAGLLLAGAVDVPSVALVGVFDTGLVRDLEVTDLHPAKIFLSEIPFRDVARDIDDPNLADKRRTVILQFHVDLDRVDLAPSERRGGGKQQDDDQEKCLKPSHLAIS